MALRKMDKWPNGSLVQRSEVNGLEKKTTLNDEL